MIRIAAARDDGTPRPFVTIGHVRLGQDVFVRSLNGPDGACYRAAVRSGQGEIEVGGRRLAIAFLPDVGREGAVDRALRARYGDDSGVRGMTRSLAREATLRVALPA